MDEISEWFDIAAFGLSPREVDAVSEALDAVVPDGVVVAETRDGFWIEHLKTTRPEDARFDVHVYIAGETEARLTFAAACAEFSKRRLETVLIIGNLGSVDWSEAWRRAHGAVKPGARIVVRPPWVERSSREDEIDIVIEPGMAFGSGKHASTQACLVLLERIEWNGRVVLDIGAGSGVLSAAAAAMGAGRVLAIDILAAAAENAARAFATNDLSSRTLSVRATIDAVRGAFDAILMNIFADVNIELLPRAASRLSPGGVMVLGGMLLDSFAEVARVAESHGLIVHERLDRDAFATCIVARESKTHGQPSAASSIASSPRNARL